MGMLCRRLGGSAALIAAFLVAPTSLEVARSSVSGGKSLDQRPGLSAAVAAIEAGEADVVAAAYFDRLFRSLSFHLV